MFRNRKKRVLIVTAYTIPYSFGGGNNAYNWTIYLNSIGENAKVLAYNGVNKRILNTSKEHIIQVGWFNKNFFTKILSLFWVAPICFYLGLTSSVVYIIGAHFVGIFFVIIGAKLSGIKIIFRSTLMGDDDPKTLVSSKGTKNYFRKKTITSANLYHAINPVFLQDWDALKVKKNQNTILMVQGLDTAKFNSNQRHKNKESIPEASLSLLSVGFIIKRKGFEELFEKLSTLTIPFKYQIATNPQLPNYFDAETMKIEMDNLMAYGRELLVNKLSFLYPQEGIQTVYANADILLLNSRTEGTPNVILEAMACGVIPVVRELPGFKDFIIKDGVTGFLYSDIDKLNSILDRLCTNRDLMQQVSVNASEFAQQNFSFERVWTEIRKGIENE